MLDVKLVMCVRKIAKIYVGITRIDKSIDVMSLYKHVHRLIILKSMCNTIAKNGDDTFNATTCSILNNRFFPRDGQCS